MSSSFELIRDKDGKFGFILKSGSGETILSSSKKYLFPKGSILTDIAQVQQNCGSSALYVKQTSGGKHCFNIVTRKNEALATSAQYDSEDSLDAVIAMIKTEGQTETIKTI